MANIGSIVTDVGTETLKAKAEQSGNPYAVAASVVLPFIIKKLLPNIDADYGKFRDVTGSQADTQNLLQSNLQSQLRGESTPALEAIMGRLEQQQQTQRQGTAASLQRTQTGGGPGTGATFQAAQKSRQDEQFNQIMANLIGQFTLSAQQTAAGQSGTLAQAQAVLAQKEAADISALNKSIGDALASERFGDRVSKMYADFVRNVFRPEGTDIVGGEVRSGLGSRQSDLPFQDSVSEPPRREQILTQEEQDEEEFGAIY